MGQRYRTTPRRLTRKTPIAKKKRLEGNMVQLRNSACEFAQQWEPEIFDERLRLRQSSKDTNSPYGRSFKSPPYCVSCTVCLPQASITLCHQRRLKKQLHELGLAMRFGLAQNIFQMRSGGVF